MPLLRKVIMNILLDSNRNNCPFKMQPELSSAVCFTHAEENSAEILSAPWWILTPKQIKQFFSFAVKYFYKKQCLVYFDKYVSVCIQNY